jgi:hypothetical protein
MPNTIKIRLPKLHDGQQKIKDERKRFNVICCGRRFGKNILLQDLAIETALYQRLPVAWATPIYSDMVDDWRMLENLLAPTITRKNSTDHRMEMVGGGFIKFWSLDNYDAIRGKKYARFIVNEAGLVASLMDAWNYVIRPTLVDMKGDAYFAGTPKGYNGFWNFYNLTDAEWMRWKMSSYTNPHIPASELGAMRLTMPERAFNQEIMAEFIEDGGGVFRGVQKAATATRLDSGIAGHQYAFGADWGRSNDATVFAVIDMDTFQCVYIDRMLDTDYAMQRIRLKALAQRFNNPAGLVEANSIGQPQIEQLQREGLSVSGFQTTNASKAQILDALALAFEQQKLTIIDDPVLIAELLAYQSERLPSGMVRYGAPEGQHDDTVIALALAWWAAAGSGTWFMS